MDIFAPAWWYPLPVFAASVLGATISYIMVVRRLEHVPMKELIESVFPSASMQFYYRVSTILSITIAPFISLLIVGATDPRAAFLAGFVTPIILGSISSPIVKSRTVELYSELHSIEERLKEKPERPELIWERSRIRLEPYIQRNIAQVRSIYWITIAVMLAGFSLVLYGVYSAFSGSALEVSVLAAASGVVTQFIGASFLVIYRSAMGQAGEYVATLERINAVGMAVQIVDSMADDLHELKNTARADLVKEMLKGYAR